MRPSHQALVLVGIITQNGVVTAGSALPRGVSPEFAKFYETKDTFTCIGHPSIAIPSSRVNDNSCDCPDGTDEPGTAACALLDRLSPEQPFPSSQTGTTNTTNALPGFWCANKGHVGAYVPFLYVNDGVCDYDLCCDGTEEYGRVGGIKCENKCAEIGKEYRRIEKERGDGLERANKRRRTMVKESKELRRRVEAKIGTLTEEIKELEVKREDLKAKLDEVERQERFKVVKNEGTGKLGVLVGLAKKRVDELRETLRKVASEHNKLRARVSELEGILTTFKDEYNPNFNDEGVKKAVRAWEDYSVKKAAEVTEELNEVDIQEITKEDTEESGINWKEYEEEEGTDTDILYSFEAYLPGSLREFLHTKINLFRIWLIENGLLADTGSGKTESRLVKAAREAHDSVANDVNAKVRDLDDQKRDLEKDYGKDDIFRYLKGKCIATEAGEYEYELCWLDKTSQKSKKGGGKTNMGNFDRFDWGEADEEERHDGKGLGRGKRLVLRYENGQGCWNGPNRKTDVWLACAETEELWRVSELEKCVYKMEVGTPAACEEAAAEPGHVKDEL
ncbi:glucosidase II beta subunit-like protein-domain-containing protein [Durotheca rogersii]|uniref:glucosidase II beta subunit-like protein-domain-containing protein n=1 Tax=Durotheca rogersii TaxID=419775 RepID=UPI00221F703F|nr:glucosidase II beta subunit-like protein-domain-containing protein [Durotheca rogersii]KAI5860912.1 glucosidase II beta subunit-like protein-domain-containing protein [Durotheca rogersii]